MALGIQIIGTCIETNQLVVAKVYTCSKAFNVPLKELFSRLIAENYLIDKAHLYAEMLEDGVQPSEIEILIHDAMPQFLSYITDDDQTHYS